MPRQRRIAEREPAPPPKRKSDGSKTNPAEMRLRRRVIWRAMTQDAPIDKVMMMMANKWPELDEKAVQRLIDEAEAELKARMVHTVSLKRLKQEARMLDHIAEATQAKAFSAISSLEKTFADIAGTNAPIRVQHDVSYTDRQNDAFKRAFFMLSEEQGRELLGGKGAVPLGLAGALPIRVIETTAEPAPTNGNGKPKTNGKAKTNGNGKAKT